ncbi:MAG: GMC family oxidoreductase N-terminal domain-containing protein, partial [Alphaproteobacteria bacterium]
MTDIGAKRFDYIILGGGSAGCVLANRLTASGRKQVLLVEAGKDYGPGEEPADMLDSYPMGASFNPAYHWRELKVRLSHTPTNSGQRAAPRFMEQARVVGGGSSINAQMANRGSPLDYDEWEDNGARG